MSVKDLIMRLRIEEDNKLSKKRVNFYSMFCRENMIKQVVKSHNKKKRCLFWITKVFLRNSLSNALYITRLDIKSKNI
jgi:23S rRNA A1618 N6-methylase RlmF